MFLCIVLCLSVQGLKSSKYSKLDQLAWHDNCGIGWNTERIHWGLCDREVRAFFTVSELHNGWHVVTREWRLGISLRCHIPHNMLIGNSPKRNRLISPKCPFLSFLYMYTFKFIQVHILFFVHPASQMTGEWHGGLSRHLSPNYPGPPSRWCIVTLVTAWQSSHSLYLILTSIHRVIRRGGQTEQGGRCQRNEQNADPSHAVLMHPSHRAYSIKKDKCRDNVEGENGALSSQDKFPFQNHDRKIFVTDPNLLVSKCHHVYSIHLDMRTIFTSLQGDYAKVGQKKKNLTFLGK